MKIGLVLPAPPGYSETFFRSKIKGLTANGVEVVLFVNSSTRVADLPCIVKAQLPVYQSGLLNTISVILTFVKALFSYPKVVSKFIPTERRTGKSWQKVLESLYINHHILSEKQLDWLHFGFATMAVGREQVAQAIGAKMAVSFRGYDVSIYPLKHNRCYDLLWQKLDKVHTISDDLFQIACGLGLSSKVAFKKITPAINIRQFERTSTNHQLLTTKEQPLNLLTVARLHWKKGLEYTLQALVLSKNKGIDFRYTIIGEGEEYERLAFAAHQLGIREQVHFAGKVPHNQIKAYYEQADIYLQYSIQEGFCNAVLEAQAMGLLCIVSDAEGLPENVLHGQSGWVVPKRHPQLLAEQINQVLQMDEQKLNAIRRFAVQRVQEEFNLEKQQREFLEFYMA